MRTLPRMLPGRSHVHYRDLSVTHSWTVTAAHTFQPTGELDIVVLLMTLFGGLVPTETGEFRFKRYDETEPVAATWSRRVVVRTDTAPPWPPPASRPNRI